MSFDWFPGTRMEQLVMARNWIAALTPEKRKAWGIAAEDFTNLGALFDAAQGALQKAQDDTQRTPVVTAQCGAAFKTLEAKMRYFKKRYFMAPPLTAAELVSLGLTPADTSHTPIPPPRDEAEAELGFPDYHLIEVRNIRRRGLTSGDLRSYHGVRIHLGIVDGTGPCRIAAAPATGADLLWSKFTRRRRERFDLDGNSGKEVYVSLAYENAKGESGPSGPILKGTIP
jgi:hypothetical protein